MVFEKKNFRHFKIFRAKALPCGQKIALLQGKGDKKIIVMFSKAGECINLNRYRK